jgi:hypothetical protein
MKQIVHGCLAFYPFPILWWLNHPLRNPIEASIRVLSQQSLKRIGDAWSLFHATLIILSDAQPWLLVA